MLVMRTAPDKAVEATSSPNSKDSEHATAIQLASPRDLWWYDPRRVNEFSSDPQFPDIRVNHTGVNAILEPLTALSSHSEESLVLHDLGLQLSLRRGFETILSLQTLQHVSPFPHQIRTAERILRHMRGRALLCDEVGLGKTVEAGLILHEYRVRGLVHNALILTPASLTTQWREEMIRKFDLPFVRYDSEQFRSKGQSWETFPFVVASLDTAKREPHRSHLLDQAYDLVIVDEAHHLKNRNTQAWKFINQIKKKYILLLTATPVENSMDDLFNLITLLRPGQLHTASEYKKKFVSRKDPLQPQNVDELKRLIQSVMIRNRRSTTGVIQTGRTAETMIVTPTPEEQRLYEKLSGFVRRQVAGNKAETPLTPPFVLKNLLRQAGSSGACVLPTLRKISETSGNRQGTDGSPGDV
jgi:SNF2 family DNA or RNA helicase